MKDDNTTIEIRDQTGRTTGPLSRQEFGHRVKLVSQKLANDRRQSADQSKPDMGDFNAPLAQIPIDADFKRDWLEDDDLQTRGEDMARKKFPDLEQFDIRFLWKKEGGAKGGKAILGKITLARGFTLFYSKAEAIVWLAADHLRIIKATEKVIDAVLFHELCHAVLKDGKEGVEPGLQLIGYDYEGFLAELREFGAWRTDLTRMAEAVGQLELFKK